MNHWKPTCFFLLNKNSLMLALNLFEILGSMEKKQQFTVSAAVPPPFLISLTLFLFKETAMPNFRDVTFLSYLCKCNTKIVSVQQFQVSGVITVQLLYLHNLDYKAFKKEYIFIRYILVSPAFGLSEQTKLKINYNFKTK